MGKTHPYLSTPTVQHTSLALWHTAGWSWKTQRLCTCSYFCQPCSRSCSIPMKSRETLCNLSEHSFNFADHTEATWSVPHCKPQHSCTFISTWKGFSPIQGVIRQTKLSQDDSRYFHAVLPWQLEEPHGKASTTAAIEQYSSTAAASKQAFQKTSWCYKLQTNALSPSMEKL